jgi:DNA-binding IscR family transcriptional regulator
MLLTFAGNNLATALFLIDVTDHTQASEDVTDHIERCEERHEEETCLVRGLWRRPS